MFVNAFFTISLSKECVSDHSVVLVLEATFQIEFQVIINMGKE